LLRTGLVLLEECRRDDHPPDDEDIDASLVGDIFFRRIPELAGTKKSSRKRGFLAKEIYNKF